PPRSTLFPDTTLSDLEHADIRGGDRQPGGAERVWEIHATTVDLWGFAPHKRADKGLWQKGRSRLVRPGICPPGRPPFSLNLYPPDRKSTRLNSSHVKL